MNKKRPNILYIMCDQLRFDTIAALGNCVIKTPNIDRLVERGTSFNNAYSPTPVCIPARYSIRTGRDAYNNGCYCNESPVRPVGQIGESMEDWTGPYLARVMGKAGYRTFGIGKFHTFPDSYEELGYEVHIHTEEMWDSPELRNKDGYIRFIEDQHPAFSYLEQIHGERTNMYYVPQLSSLPSELTVESFVADKAIEQLQKEDERPYFGFVSFIGPHPPCAPPIPYNRMYDPDGMQNPYVGSIEEDHTDEQIPWMNSIIYADEINNAWARNLKTRYYGEISYIDSCIGRILDEVEKHPDAENTLICFFTDHGDMLGDHHGWQKETFYESSVRIPFIISYPPLVEEGNVSNDLVSLTDLFGLATTLAGVQELRDGIDILTQKRDYLFSFYGRPKTRQFKIMTRYKEWKYIYMANGGREQLFNLQEDPMEMQNLIHTHKKIAEQLRSVTLQKCIETPELISMTENNQLVRYPFEARPLGRLHQFDFSRNITDYSVPSGKGFISEALPNTTQE